MTNISLINAEVIHAYQIGAGREQLTHTTPHHDPLGATLQLLTNNEIQRKRRKPCLEVTTPDFSHAIWRLFTIWTNISTPLNRHLISPFLIILHFINCAIGRDIRQDKGIRSLDLGWLEYFQLCSYHHKGANNMNRHFLSTPFIIFLLSWLSRHYIYCEIHFLYNTHEYEA